VKLYHWTLKKNLPGIAKKGLEPHNGGIMTLGHSCVWLTTQETLRPTAWDRRHYERHIKSAKKRHQFKDSMFANVDVRLVVNVPKTRYLVRYHPWLCKQNVMTPDEDGQWQIYFGKEVAKVACSHTPRKHWWLYLNSIEPSHIQFPAEADAA
jgi:hypothetical protein